MLSKKHPPILLIVTLLLVAMIQINLVHGQEVRPECTMDWTPTFPEFEAYDPPIRITTPFPAAATFIGDDTFTDNPMYNRVLSQLGIQYEIAWQSNDNTQLQTAIASGNLPDVFPAGGTGGEAAATLSLLIENGAVADITYIWEETASDLTKEMKGYPDADMWTSVTRSRSVSYGINLSSRGH